MSAAIIERLGLAMVALAATASELILSLYLFCPSEAEWRHIDAMYAEAARQHEFICVYAVNSFPDLLRGTAFNVWVYQPATLHAALVVFTTSIVFVGAAYVWSKPQGSN